MGVDEFERLFSTGTYRAEWMFYDGVGTPPVYRADIWEKFQTMRVDEWFTMKILQTTGLCAWTDHYELGISQRYVPDSMQVEAKKTTTGAKIYWYGSDFNMYLISEMSIDDFQAWTTGNP